MTKKIVYKDKERDVVVIAKPSDNYFMFDLSEYPESEQDFYESEYERIHSEYLDKIKELGLSSNYRYFNKEKIDWIEEYETA